MSQQGQKIRLEIMNCVLMSWRAPGELDRQGRAGAYHCRQVLSWQSARGRSQRRVGGARRKTASDVKHFKQSHGIYVLTPACFPPLTYSWTCRRWRTCTWRSTTSPWRTLWIPSAAATSNASSLPFCTDSSRHLPTGFVLLSLSFLVLTCCPSVLHHFFCYSDQISTAYTLTYHSITTRMKKKTISHCL